MQFRAEFPAHPEQDQPAHKEQARNLQQLRGEDRRHDPADQGKANADEQRLLPLLRRQASGREPNDDRVVPRQSNVDEDDLREGAQFRQFDSHCAPRRFSPR